MRFLLVLLVLLPNITFASASANCPIYPKAEWADIETLRQALVDEGYTI